jgi:site-specific DNA-methyltransferase (adenine-specific)
MPENTPHPTQKPEKLVAKLILASSNPSDTVFDPFLGSGTTAVTAKKLGRHFIGIEREKEYVAYALQRLQDAEHDKHIQGFENGVFRSRNFSLTQRRAQKHGEQNENDS